MTSNRPIVITLAAVACSFAFTTIAFARSAGPDLKREIDAQRAAVPDLERLDETHTVGNETTLLRSWLDEASSQHAKEEFDRVREVLDRCIAQAEMIRQKTAAAKLSALAKERETALKASRDKFERTKLALQQAMVNKKALEMNAK